MEKQKESFLDLRVLEVKDLGNNIKLQVFENAKGDIIYDIRYFYANNSPTKRGIRFNKTVYNKLLNIQNN